MSRWRDFYGKGLPRRALAFAQGGATVGAFAPLGWFPLLWLTLAGLFALLRAAGSGREGFWTGWFFGFGLFLGGVSWVYVSLSVFGGMPLWLAAPATGLFCAALAVFPGLAGWAFCRWRPAAAWRQAGLFAALWGFQDWLRGWAFTGFPWLAAGYSQTPPSPLAGFAPLVGVYGLSFLAALAAAAVAMLVPLALPARRRGWGQGSRRWPLWPLALLPLLMVSGGALRSVAWTEPAGEPVTVALVQGNIPQDMKFRPELFLRTLILYRDLVDQHPAKLTILPETAFPAFYDQLPPEYLAELQALAARQQGDIVFGAVTGSGEGYWNSAITLGASTSQTYSKSHLVPFGEIVPPGFAWFMALADIPMSSFSRGPVVQPPLMVGGVKVAADICYEDAFGEEIIRALPEAGVLANLSNTAWFGDSLAQPQHLQIARLRALETGRPMLRATNTGMTAAVAPDGSIQAGLAPFTRGVLTTRVRPYAGITPYVRLGNWPALALMVGAAFLAMLPRRRHGR